MVRRHVPEARVVTGLDDAPRENRHYEIDGAMILKVARRRCFRRSSSLLREAIWLARAPARARVPRILGSGTAYGTEYGLQSLVRGVPVQGTTAVGWQPTAALAQLGETLALLHGVTLTKAERELFPPVSVEALRRQTFDELEDLLALCPEIDGRHVHRKLEQAWKRLPVELPTVVVHGALTTHNVLLDPESGQLAALVELAEARRGPAALDLAAIWPDSTRASVLSGYKLVAPLPPGLDALTGALDIVAALRKHRARRDAKADTLMVYTGRPRGR